MTFYLPRSSALADISYLGLAYPGYQKTNLIT